MTLLEHHTYRRLLSEDITSTGRQREGERETKEKKRSREREREQELQVWCVARRILASLDPII